MHSSAADGNEYGSTGGSGLYRSSDSAETFTQVGAGSVTAVYRLGFGAATAGTYPKVFHLGHSTVHQLTGDPQLFERVYVGAEGRGILYTTQE